MVLESIVGSKNIRKNPFLIFFITVLITVGSIIAAYNVFPRYASVLSVAFITIGLVPLIHNVLAKEEYEDRMLRKSSTTFFARHFNLIMIYVWVFIGIIFTFAIFYYVAPSELKTDLFSEQINSLCAISGSSLCEGSVPLSITGNVAASAFDSCRNPDTSNVLSCSFFIFQNNFRVLIFVIILSLLYGAGAIFIIAWNASILGLFFGEMLSMGAHSAWLGFLQSMLIGHGPPELFAYIFGALAGGILSAMIARGVFIRYEIMTALKDFGFLVFLAFFSVVYGAIVEGVGILGYSDLHFILGFLYVLIIIIIVAIYGKKNY